jgi:hypothetical protein
MFTPVLLTLLDDSATRVKSRGLRIATKFLEKIPSSTLRDTGIGSVFEQAIFPTLLYLPSITPEAESLQLLDPAFDALFVLGQKLPTGKDSKEKNKLLDKVLREGIFVAYFHAREHVRIVEVLVRQAGTTAKELGFHSVKHLKVSG